MKNNKGFTLVELIVVVTILSILSTIWFVSYSWYLAWVRDTNRTSQLKAIWDALHLYTTKSSLPNPDEKKIDIMDWSTKIATQWYVWKTVIETIWYTAEWKDPKDNTYFSYYLTKDRKYFQLMAYLEEEPWTSTKLRNNTNLTEAAIDYEVRYPTVEWKKLWILTTDTNEPVQETETTLDISNVWTTNTYKSYLKTDEVLEWNWTSFSQLTDIAKVWWRWYTASGNTVVFQDLDEGNSSSSAKIHWTLASDMTWWVAKNTSCNSCLDWFTKRFDQMSLLECEVFASKHKATMFYADSYQHPSTGSDSWRLENRLRLVS